MIRSVQAELVKLTRPRFVAITIVVTIVVAAALTAAIAWNVLTWWFGVPSSSHALIAGLVGAGLAPSRGPGRRAGSASSGGPCSGGSCSSGSGRRCLRGTARRRALRSPPRRAAQCCRASPPSR